VNCNVLCRFRGGGVTLFDCAVLADIFSLGGPMTEKKGDGRRIMCGKVASGWIVVRIDAVIPA